MPDLKAQWAGTAHTGPSRCLDAESGVNNGDGPKKWAEPSDGSGPNPKGPGTTERLKALHPLRGAGHGSFTLSENF